MVGLDEEVEKVREKAKRLSEKAEEIISKLSEEKGMRPVPMPPSRIEEEAEIVRRLVVLGIFKIAKDLIDFIEAERKQWRVADEREK
jgi:hypothetical protein